MAYDDFLNVPVSCEIRGDEASRLVGWPIAQLSFALSGKVCDKVWCDYGKSARMSASILFVPV